VSDDVVDDKLALATGRKTALLVIKQQGSVMATRKSQRERGIFLGGGVVPLRMSESTIPGSLRTAVGEKKWKPGCQEVHWLRAKKTDTLTPSRWRGAEHTRLLGC
jgi:hypothetical protein